MVSGARGRLANLGLALVFISYACGDSGTAPTTATSTAATVATTTNDGLQEVRSSEHGYSMAVPEGWLVVDLTGDPEVVADQLEARLPAVAEAVRRAGGFDVPGGLALVLATGDTVSVVVERRPPFPEADADADEFASAMREHPLRDQRQFHEVERVELPAGPAVVTTFSLRGVAFNRTYIVVREKANYALTFTGRFDTYDTDLYDTIAASFEVQDE